MNIYILFIIYIIFNNKMVNYRKHIEKEGIQVFLPNIFRTTKGVHKCLTLYTGNLLPDFP